MTEPDKKEKIGIKLIMRSLFVMLFFVLITFLAAGRLDYWQGWVFNALNFFFVFLTVFILRDRKDLIKERLKPGIGMKQWDKVYYAVSTPVFFFIIIFSIVDATRFSWEPQVPFIVMLSGITLYCIGQIIGLWAKNANRFFSSVVRIQTDRKQTVCSSGPYRFVRHPGYLSGIIFTIGTPLMLGSYWGVGPAIVALLLMCIRTYKEDITLQHELPGYWDYIQKVRYRIIPFLW